MDPLNAAKTFIDQLYEEKTKAASSDLANAIKTITSGVLKGRLPYEFIQNADDASLTDNGSLSFSLIDTNILVITHDGKPFTQTDIKKICSVAQQQFRDKIDDPKMIGQKGVGIKATFADASDMIVYTDPYCFSFKENYKAWANQTREKPYPWQITPIWTDPKQLPTGLDPKKVHFVLTLRDPEAMRKQLEDLIQTPRILLFLNRIRRITLLEKKLELKISKFSPKLEKREFYIDGILTHQWIVAQDTNLIPKPVKDSLKTLNPEECPDRLKKEDYALKLVFAFSVGNNGQFSQSEKTTLSCYLPTTVQLGFPFEVNGEFLLDASRKHLTSNEWNAFVLETIARRHFYWLSIAAKLPTYRIGILNLLPPLRLTGIDDKLIKGYEKGCSEFRQVKFIPAERNPDTLLALDECQRDPTGFFKAFYKDPTDENIPNLIHSRLENQQVLTSSFEVPTWTLLDIISQINNFVADNRELISPLLLFFKKHWDKAKLHLTEFKQNCLLPDGHGGIKSIDDFYLKGDDQTDYPACLKIPLLPDDCQTNELKKWLHEALNLRDLSPKEVITHHLVDFVNTEGITLQNTLLIMQFLYDAISYKLIHLSDLSNLSSKIKVLNKAGTLSLIQSCFLPNIYKPSFPLETVSPEDKNLFISDRYSRKDDQVDLWRTLLTKLGGLHEVKITIWTDTIANLRVQNVSQLNAYLEQLYKGSNSPLKGAAKDTSKHTLTNFVFLPFMHFLHIKAYSDHFWNQVNKNWNQLLTACGKSQYKLTTGERPLDISYIQYMVRANPLCTHKNEPTRLSELYAPHLNQLVQGYFQTLDIPFEMTYDQAVFFGFKLNVHPLHCLDILEGMCIKRTPTDIDKYRCLLKEIMCGFERATPEDKSKFQQRAKFIIAEDGSWQPSDPNKIKCSLIPEANERFDRKDRVKLVLPLNEMEALSQLMNFGLIREIAEPFEVPDAFENATLKSNLSKRLPLLSLYIAYKKVGQEQIKVEAKKLLQYLSPLIKSLKIYSAKKIPTALRSTETCDILFMAPATLYYKERCSEKWRKISQKLAAYFKIEGFDPLLSEILSLKDESYISQFITDHGLSIEILNELKLNYNRKELTLDTPEDDIVEIEEINTPPPPDTPLNSEPVIDNDDEDNPADDNEPPLKAFTTEISPKTIPFEKIIINKLVDPPKNENEDATKKVDKTRKLKNPQGEAPINKASNLSDEDKSAIGKWGEEFIYNYLIHRFKNHQEPTFKTQFICLKTESINEGTGTRFTCRKNNEETTFTIDLIWLNQVKEQGDQKDLEVIWKQNEKILKTRFLEVKASKEQGVHFLLSGLEWQFMNDNAQNYRIYHVKNAGKKEENALDKRVTKIRNLNSANFQAFGRLEFSKKNS